MATSGGGLSLYEAARAVGVIFTEEAEPEDSTVMANGLRFHYLDWGNDGKPTMLLLHGRTQSAHSWDFAALAFRADYHVISLNQRGHGESEWAPDGDYTGHAQVQDVAEVVSALGLAPVVVIGHSMGGRNAMVYAGKHPDELRALVVVEMAPARALSEAPRMGIWHLLPTEADSLEEYVEAAQRVNPRRTKEQLRGSLRHQLRQFSSGKWSWKWDPVLRDTDVGGWSSDEMWQFTGSIQCPTLFVRGGESNLISDETAQRITMEMSDAKVLTVPNAGHLVPGDKPAAFQQVVQEFLGGLT